MWMTRWRGRLPWFKHRRNLVQEIAANLPLVDRAAKGMEDLEAGRYSLAGTETGTYTVAGWVYQMFPLETTGTTK